MWAEEGRREEWGGSNDCVEYGGTPTPQSASPQIAATDPNKNKIAVSVANSTVNSSHNYKPRFPHLIQ